MFQFAEKDLRLLKVFMTVVDSGGYTAAQAELNVGTSTISNHMSKLEERLGARLCQRGRIGFQLTDKGEFVYQAARRLFAVGPRLHRRYGRHPRATRRRPQSRPARFRHH